MSIVLYNETGVGSKLLLLYNALCARTLESRKRVNTKRRDDTDSVAIGLFRVSSRKMKLQCSHSSLAITPVSLLSKNDLVLLHMVRRERTNERFMGDRSPSP